MTQTGNLYGTVVDDKSQVLPGATITLTGQGAPQVQITDAQGQFRFMELSPGSYEVKAELEGFSPAEQPVTINAGRNTDIEMALQLAVFE